MNQKNVGLNGSQNGLFQTGWAEGLYKAQSKIYKVKNRAKYLYSKYKNMEMEVSYI